MNDRYGLSIDELQEKLEYNPVTGVFKWKISIGCKAKGQIAGNIHPNGYVAIRINTIRYLAHRLAWLYEKGCWPPPPKEIDHINGVGTDNRWVNLRLANRAENISNSARRKDSTSGFKGVTLCKKTYKWVAQIHVNYRHIHLGQFTSKKAAHAAYVKAAKKYFGEFHRAG